MRAPPSHSKCQMGLATQEGKGEWRPGFHLGWMGRGAGRQKDSGIYARGIHLSFVHCSFKDDSSSRTLDWPYPTTPHHNGQIQCNNTMSRNVPCLSASRQWVLALKLLCYIYMLIASPSFHESASSFPIITIMLQGHHGNKFHHWQQVSLEFTSYQYRSSSRRSLVKNFGGKTAPD